MARHGDNIRKRKDGRWEARLYVQREDGKKTCKSFYGSSYRQAKEKRRLYQCSDVTIQTACKPDIWGFSSVPLQAVPRLPITVKALADEWLNYKASRVKSSTYMQYRFYLDRYILPLLGQNNIIEINTDTIDRAASYYICEGSLRQGCGLSPKTVNSILSVIKMLWQYAQSNKNYPVQLISITYYAPAAPKISVLSTTEQIKLVKRLQSEPDGISLGILISLFTGLRIGEVCGLRWGDISFQNATMRVERTVQRIQNPSPDREQTGKTILLITTPKTIHSVREIPLCQFLLKQLASYQHDNSLYLLTCKKTCMEPRNLYRAYKRIMKELDLGNYSFHALRHTFATRWIENGLDVKSLSEILGHEDIHITLKRYVHPSLSVKREQINRLAEDIIRGMNQGQAEN